MPDSELTRRFQARIRTIGETAGALTARHFAATGNDEADIPEFSRLATPTLAGAKRASIATAVAYYALLVGARPPSVRPDEISVQPDTREPFIAYWRALKMGRPLEEAIESGLARARAMTAHLAVSSARRTGDVTLAKTGHEPEGWKRITDSDVCEWCIDQAVYVYASSEAADFGHERCHCTPRPIL